MDMPARIMAEQIGIAKKDGQSFGVGRWIADEAAPNATAYVRADLHDALAAENARLIHDIERAQVALSEMATDNEKLRKLLQEVLAVAERNERGVVTDAARAAITEAP